MTVILPPGDTTAESRGAEQIRISVVVQIDGIDTPGIVVPGNWMFAEVHVSKAQSAEKYNGVKTYNEIQQQRLHDSTPFVVS